MTAQFELDLNVYYLLCCDHLMMVFNFRKFLIYEINLRTMKHGTNLKYTIQSHQILCNYHGWTWVTTL